MKEIKVNTISKELNISHSAVSQWFSGKTKPKIEYAIKMNELFNIPFEAWKDIKSYVNDSISSTQNIKQLPNEKEM
ncbi:hypothetical protein CKA55_07405 [Arcobacter suis]|uniref:Transcriptional regulator, XRE family n=1 Tax=Arcobacter suis CECT 7833 TaxID=663365 RepID=A0AAD0WQI5_9BACT|nr:helix-turn-helix transcriptional regulator [Arcobacter suis]AXX89322.1 putative transcriptional regulator, XRE family [Arcobacter suis CECT 7833]RWS46556.1 hypothetical protein CKA55_07405 [Arcobacter suis]